MANNPLFVQSRVLFLCIKENYVTASGSIQVQVVDQKTTAEERKILKSVKLLKISRTAVKSYRI
jgi:hypothetical protein